MLSFCTYQISQRVYELMKSKCSAEAWVSTEVEISELDCAKGQSQKENNCFSNGFSDKADGVHHLGLEKDAKRVSHLNRTNGARLWLLEGKLS